MHPENLPDNLDYPQPDPTWDYGAEYQAAIALHKESQALINTMSGQETHAPQADQALRDHLKQISEHINMILSRLN